MRLLRGFILVCAMSGSLALRAQFEYAEILGTVRDASGGVVQRAKVTVRGLSTNVQTSTLTNDQGNYSFPNLRAGSYEVTTTAPGFRLAKSDELTLRVSDRLRVDMNLETGGTNEQVTVVADAAPCWRPIPVPEVRSSRASKSRSCRLTSVTTRNWFCWRRARPTIPISAWAVRSASMATGPSRTTICWTV